MLQFLSLYICERFIHISASLLDVLQIENQYFLDLFISQGLCIPTEVYVEASKETVHAWSCSPVVNSVSA